MFQDIPINELLALKSQGELTVIDVRSPSEYKEATIPGSMNIPFFNDEERAEVGTLYKQVSPQAAKERGLEIVSAKLPAFVKEFSEIEGKKAVFCWRGGMRSKTSATVLSLMGIKALRLEGGYRSYRHWVVEQLESMELKQEAYVLNGNTGSGKTTILHRLREEGFPVIDLEGMAGHRGSIFGQIGLNPHNQKTFDALLVENLKRLESSPFLLFEGESKRIGKVTLPKFFSEKKEQGIQLFIDMPVEERVLHILDDYQPWNHKQECLDAFSRIKKRIHTPIAKQIEEDLLSDNYSSAVRSLLEHYYDPLYRHSTDQYPEDRKVLLKVKNIDEAVEAVRDYVAVKQR
ncbi:tRNA 2-selenouridine(34) synthase MnmH [Bacillus thermotolerans]|uniref:Selenophosphate-dependent tRNA 2-selenouridine synthase n=1 Tax=Bacillus thermotolerans TaxID=1221996 RepID=A0A0F5I5C6_BACTR|nr:tRNA 2-selenouridine(34) synthase MnmH [Bacillus thermotolerans]KKB33777.1 Selenophosphate-dependent tRNA 2-selenouridine synthase [Bacillus thermotolerans]KKB40342.1 Selenophosphate-dependent tRNA 2-selenouridine synthase [Bacillus thermotolerans]KKB44187.1 Selenophosphate-dependent tRNA 2-selenouridine synthase [Bacillus thermotolerans]